MDSQKDKDRYAAQCHYYDYLCTEAKTTFLSQTVDESVSDKHKLFSVAKDLMNWYDDAIFPSDSTNLPDKFGNYFADKIVTIQSIIATQQSSISDLKELQSEIATYSSSTSLTLFEPTTESEVRTVMTSMSNATPELNPIPTDIPRGLLRSKYLLHMTKIINLSLSAAEVFLKEHQNSHCKTPY